MITRDSVCAYREFQRQAERAERQHRLALAQLTPDSPEARSHQRALYYVTAWKRWEQRRQRLDKKATRWLRQGWRDYWRRVWRDNMNA
jgi:hypothetical protein